MIKLKKVLSLLCSAALVAATLVMPITNVSADDSSAVLSYGLKSGVTAPSGSAKKGYFTYAVLNCDGFCVSDNEWYTTCSGMVAFKVTKGVFSDAAGNIMANDAGLYAIYGSSNPAYTANVQSFDDDYDLLKLLWSGDSGWTTDTNDLCEISLKIANKSLDFSDVEFIPYPEISYINLCGEDLKVSRKISGSEFVNENYKYTMTGGTNTITKTKITEEPTTYAVTTAATENGTVAVDKDTAAEGETVTITTTPDEGYEVDTVTAGAETVTTVTENETYTFVMPAKAVEVAVTFKAKAAPVDPNAAEKIEGNFKEGNKDYAVAFKKVFDADTLAGKTLMKLTATVDGVARVYKGDAVAIPNVDGELTLGVIIQYGDANINVESLAIELQ